jgi:DNA repair exonuclease SbcCD nuclease subunit
MGSLGPTAIIVGDPHFKVKYLREGEQLIDKTIQIVKDKNPTFIVLLGDILDTHESVHVLPHKLATVFIQELSEIAHTFILIGNHDLIDHKQFLTENHIFNPFKQWKNVTVVDFPVYYVKDGIKFLFCPYVPCGRFIEALEKGMIDLDLQKSEWKNVNYIFAHQEFRGCKMSNIESKDGDIWCKEFPKVISGHIHGEQDLEKINVYYPGTPYQTNFGETDEKFIWFVRFKKEKFKREKINLGITGKKNIFTSIDNLFQLDLSTDKNSIKLHISGTREEFKEFRKSKKYKELKGKGVVLSFESVSEKPTNIKYDTFEKVLSNLLEQSSKPVQELYAALCK